jgi:ADP-ribosylglycohydrolase
MNTIKILLIVISICWNSCQANPQLTKISAEQLRDKIRGGLLGQMLGNLNGIPHEMDYINEPGDVTEYIPSLPQGAETDDDTDFEWVYIKIMQDENTIFLSPNRLTELWQERINRGIWCSNRYSRHLMDLGIQPPMTSNFALNPWAEFNISGQFICETFGLIAPAMPQTASRIGLNYTRITIDLEPAQTTQLFCTMIATAFITNEIEQILDAGLKSLDSKSEIRRIINDVSSWCKQYPENWRETRRLIKEKYSRHGGKMRDSNGYELNTASTIAALLYGKGDFSETLRTAFNFGWDADNTAATAGTIAGVMKGYKWMMSQGWQIVDRYKNTKRENMPEDETITSFADRIIDLSETVILKNGGRRVVENGNVYFYIKRENPANVEPLPDINQKIFVMKKEFGPQIEEIIARGGSDQEMARSAYIAICLDLAPELMKQYPGNWQKAITALNTYWKIMQNIFFDDEVPGILPIRKKSISAGLKKPDKRRPVW